MRIHIDRKEHCLNTKLVICYKWNRLLYLQHFETLNNFAFRSQRWVESKWHTRKRRLVNIRMNSMWNVKWNDIDSEFGFALSINRLRTTKQINWLRWHFTWIEVAKIAILSALALHRQSVESLSSIGLKININFNDIPTLDNINNNKILNKLLF